MLADQPPRTTATPSGEIFAALLTQARASGICDSQARIALLSPGLPGLLLLFGRN